MRLAMHKALACHTMSYPINRSSTLNDPEILSKQPESPLAEAQTQKL